MKDIGGQAVIEGVMMKSQKGWTVAVRDPNGEIHLKREPLKKLPKLLRLPLLRGVVALWHALEEPISNTAMALTIAASILLGIGLFIILPLYIAKLLGIVLPAVDQSSLLFNLADGIARVLVFLLYMVLIGLWSEMRRVFEYHGAEHKVIHAYETGKDIDVQSARRFSPRHPRCGRPLPGSS
jgi:uncharacterized protein YqhQ